jgi:hypothetical protein
MRSVFLKLKLRRSSGFAWAGAGWNLQVSRMRSSKCKSEMSYDSHHTHIYRSILRITNSKTMEGRASQRFEILLVSIAKMIVCISEKPESLVRESSKGREPNGCRSSICCPKATGLLRMHTLLCISGTVPFETSILSSTPRTKHTKAWSLEEISQRPVAGKEQSLA